MKITILHDLVRWEEKALYQASLKRGLEVNLIDIKDEHFDINKDYDSKFGDVALQRTTSYYKGLHSTAIIESFGVKVINSSQILMITGNKLFTTVKLKENNVPTPRTIVAFSPEKAVEAFKELGEKAVIKPVVGSWGRMVALLDSYYSAKAVFEEREYMEPIYQVYYLQEFVNRPPRDIRAFVVGEQVIAAIYRNQPSGDFRTNTALGGKAENCPVTKEIEDLALKAARAIGSGVYGVDMMETEKGIVVHEVNGTVEFKNSVSVTGVDIPDKIIEFAIEVAKR